MRKVMADMGQKKIYLNGIIHNKIKNYKEGVI